MAAHFPPVPVVREEWDRLHPAPSDCPLHEAPGRDRGPGTIEAGGSAPHPRLSRAGTTDGAPLRRRAGKGGPLHNLPVRGG
jgi:hypothetical protein